MLKLMILPLLAVTALPGAGVNDFTADLYRKVAAGPGNLIASPFNISTALSMALVGARGKTATEMAAVLHQSHPDPTFVEQLMKSANSAGDELAMANGLWVEKGFSIQPAFQETLRKQFGAPPTPLDFSG